MTQSVLKKFGKYFLLDQIGEGGMAEIFRARLANLDQSGRFLVIKRIQGAYSNNPEFVQMFRAEVQVTMRFAHPNIVQLFEAGEESGQQFIAMELIDGRNLRQMLTRLSQQRQHFPIPAAMFIVEQTAAGLHYAHSFKDRITGEPLNLVHRDVSPQNILVSYDGNIKVIDFGIAKAAINGEATRAGVIKGKLSYLSPEQVMGGVLDARSDIFALGVVLWELLTGKKLFVAEGENEFQVLKMIESCNTFVKPPSLINPEVPPQLDQVVMNALHRDPKQRFQTGEEFARALRKAISAKYSDYGPSDLSSFVKKLFQDMIVEDRKQLQHLNTQAEELVALDKSGLSSEAIKGETRVAHFSGNKFDKAQLNTAATLEVAGSPQRQMKIPAGRSGHQVGSAGQGGSGGSVARAAPYSQRNQSRSISGMHTPLPIHAEENGSLIKKFLGLGLMVAGGYFGWEYYQQSIIDKNVDEALTKPQVEVAPRTKKAVLRVRLFPDGNISKTRVAINSQILDLEKGTIEIPIGEPLEVIVDRPGFVTYRKEFTLREEQLGNARDYGLDVKLEPMIYGTLSISTRPAVADVKILNLDHRGRGIAQESVTLKTPVYQEKLPAGTYRVVLQNEMLGVEKSFKIEIREGKETVFTDMHLESKR